MRIILTAADLSAVILAHLHTQIALQPGQEFDVDIQPGDEGYEAHINIQQGTTTGRKRGASKPTTEAGEDPKAVIAQRDALVASLKAQNAASSPEPVVEPKEEEEVKPEEPLPNISTGEERLDPETEPKPPIKQGGGLFKTPAAETPTKPAGNPNSLFANLTKPKHDPEPQA